MEKPRLVAVFQEKHACFAAHPRCIAALGYLQIRRSVLMILSADRRHYHAAERHAASNPPSRDSNSCPFRDIQIPTASAEGLLAFEAGVIVALCLFGSLAIHPHPHASSICRSDRNVEWTCGFWQRRKNEYTSRCKRHRPCHDLRRGKRHSEPLSCAGPGKRDCWYPRNSTSPLENSRVPTLDQHPSPPDWVLLVIAAHFAEIGGG